MAVEGSGGAGGLVLALQLQTSSAYEAIYTIPVAVGGSSNTYSLQVDTGSSDLWIASTACSSSSCSPVGGGNLFNPSGATQTGSTFNITYLQGSVAGPIIWDQVGVGGYSIDNQALAAASVVDSEPLTSSFQGILGLALPLNSVIASIIPPVTGNTPDGAAWASNLFSLTPVSSAPAAHFLSLSLERPGSDRVPSLLGIGRHPSSLVSDPSVINYFPLVSNKVGIIYWKVTVRAITVYVNGVRKPVNLDVSADDEEYPTAVLDSGVPVILTTPNIANGIYGALGIGPASDGNYYVPCTTPLNMTITLDDRPEIPLHPLDLTTEPPNNNRAQYCIGMIQASQALADPASGIGDMILGVPFLRNTYTVMGYDTPYANGSFPPPAPPAPAPPPPPPAAPPTSSSPDSAAEAGAAVEIHPALGLLALTNATVALEEFQTVRVLNEPLSSSGGGAGHNGTSAGGSGAPATVGPKRLSVGMMVLIVLVGFFGLCCVLFGVRWVVMRRRGVEEEGKIGMEELGGGGAAEGEGDGEGDKGKESGSYAEESEVEVRPRHRARGTGGSGRVDSEYTASSGRTRVGADDFSEFGYGIGVSGSKAELKESMGSRWSLAVADDSLVRRSIRVSQGSGGKVPQSPLHQAHERGPSWVAPLLSSPDSTTTQQQQQPQQHRHSESIDADGVGVTTLQDADELARVEDGSMAGIGTARGRLSQYESLAFPFPRESFLSGSTVGEEEPSHPPPLEDVNEEARASGETQEQREEEEEEQQEPPPHDTPIPSGAGNPVYPPRPASTTDFDPYAAP